MDLAELFESVQSGVAQVVIERNRERLTAGTAFLVPGGIVTNAHVVAGAAEVVALRFADMNDDELIRWSMDDFSALKRYESSPSDWDVTYVELNEPEFEGRHRFAFADSRSARVGEMLAFLGYPFQMANLTCHVGYVSSAFVSNGVSIIQLDASVNGGNSGGPLIDPQTGLVVGIVTRAHVGFVAEQFDQLIGALRSNVELLSRPQGAQIVVGGFDPVQAIRYSLAVMTEIAENLRRSANVGIGFAFSSDHVRSKI